MTYLDYVGYAVLTVVAALIVLVCVLLMCAVCIKAYDWWHN